MVSTPLKLSLASRVILPRQVCNQAINKPQNRFNVSFAMAFVCLTLITILVPEQPEHLASICQKHNSLVACQVW